jgi:curved DNA-binding protein CbpA
MFKDYYSILGVGLNATDQEIKQAFRTEALKWHPDRNPDTDTTPRMQDIVEANLILKDPEARARYDIVYNRYKSYQQNAKVETSEGNSSRQKKSSGTNEPSKNESFKVQDDILEDWIEKAKRQAVDLALQTIKDLKGVSSAAAKGLLSGLLQLVIWIIVVNSILFFVKLIKN